MKSVAVELTDDQFELIHQEAKRLNLTPDKVVAAALAQYFSTEELSKEDLIANLRTGMKQALAGETRPAWEVLRQIDETDHIDDQG